MTPFFFFGLVGCHLYSRDRSPVEILLGNVLVVVALVVLQASEDVSALAL